MYAKMFCTFVLIIGFFYYTTPLFNSIRHATVEHNFVSLDGLLSSCMMIGIFGYILVVNINNYGTESNYASISVEHFSKTVHIKHISLFLVHISLFQEDTHFMALSLPVNSLIGWSTAILGVVLSKIFCKFLSSNLPLGFLCACITYLYAPGSYYDLVSYNYEIGNIKQC